MERCACCKQEFRDWLPMVAVMRATDPMAADPLRTQGEWAAVRICDACWRQPPRPVKGHFFYRRDVETALEHAGSSELGG